MNRYTRNDYDDLELIKHDSGEWVKYADVNAMLLDIKKCRELLAGVLAWNKGNNEYGFNFNAIQQQIDAIDKNYALVLAIENE